MGTMAVPNEIALNLKVADEEERARYDASAKNLVSEKAVLAYILKSSLDEYSAYSVQEIAERFIVGKPEVSTIAVHQDHPNKRGDTPGYPITMRGIYYVSRMD